MNLLECARCGLIISVYGDGYHTRPCPICGGLFRLLDEPRGQDGESPVLKMIRAIEFIRKSSPR